MLFKYLSDNSWTLNTIANTEFFFSNRVQFNDPIDCDPPVLVPSKQQYRYEYVKLLSEMKNFSPDLKALLLEERVLAANFSLFEDKANLLQMLRNQADNTGILCLSKKQDDPLMWSHYADGHSGVCLGLDIPFKNEYLWESHKISEDEVGLLRQVDDTDEPLDFLNIYFVLVSIMLEKARDSYGYIDYDSGFNVFKKEKILGVMFHHFNIFNLSHKYSSWDYEQEVRLLAPPYGSIDRSRKPIKFDPTVIKRVYFGFRMQRSSMLTIRKILDNSKHEIELFQA